MQGGRANVPQKNARWPSKRMRDGRTEVKQKMQYVRAKKCKMVEQTFHKKMRGGRAKECEMAEQKNARWANRSLKKNVRSPSKKMQDGRANVPQKNANVPHARRLGSERLESGQRQWPPTARRGEGGDTASQLAKAAFQSTTGSHKELRRNALLPVL
jgi:hypothetical protein